MGTNTFGACRCICGETTVTVESGSLEHRAQVLSLALTIETGAIHRSEPTYANPETFQIGTGRAVYNAATRSGGEESACFCARPTRPVRCDYQFGICHKASTFMRSSAVPGFGFGSLVM